MAYGAKTHPFMQQLNEQNDSGFFFQRTDLRRKSRSHFPDQLMRFSPERLRHRFSHLWSNFWWGWGLEPARLQSTKWGQAAFFMGHLIFLFFYYTINNFLTSSKSSDCSKYRYTTENICQIGISVFSFVERVFGEMDGSLEDAFKRTAGVNAGL